MKNTLLLAFNLLLLVGIFLIGLPRAIHAQNGTPSGSIYLAGPVTGCKATLAGQVGICFVAGTSGSVVEISADGAAYAPMASGATNFNQMQGTISPSQLPATLNSTLTINNFALTSGGVASGSGVQASFK